MAHGVAVSVWFIISKVNLSNSCLHKVEDPEDRPEICAEGAPIFSLILGVGMLVMTLLFVFAHWTKSDEIGEIMHDESGASDGSSQRESSQLPPQQKKETHEDSH